MFHGIQKRPKWASENRPKWRPTWRGVRCVRNGRPPLRGTPIISDGNFGPSERPNWPLVEGHPMTGYLDRLIAAINAGHLTPGEAVQVDVAHGPGCPRKPCTCHPSVTVIRQHETLVIGDHGHVLERRPQSSTIPHNGRAPGRERVCQYV